MTCSNCGNESAYRLMVRYSVKDGRQECCDRCGASNDGQAMVPDVYWPGSAYKSEALDVEFTSRRQKAAVLKKMGVSEAGDMKLGRTNWVDGTRAHRKAQFEKDRPMIRENYRRYLEHARHH